MTMENSEVATELEIATRRADQLHDSVQRVEEKLSNSDSEIQVLPQQDMTLAAREPESEEDAQYLIEKQQEKDDLQNLGYAGGKPEAACVFDRIIDTLASAIAVNNNEVLVRWLSNSATLLLLLQRTLNETEAASLPPQRR